MPLFQVRNEQWPLIAELAITEPIKYFLPSVGQIPSYLLYGDSKSVIFIPDLSSVFQALSSSPALQLHGTTALPYRVLPDLPSFTAP